MADDQQLDDAVASVKVAVEITRKLEGRVLSHFVCRTCGKNHDARQGKETGVAFAIDNANKHIDETGCSNPDLFLTYGGQQGM